MLAGGEVKSWRGWYNKAMNVLGVIVAGLFGLGGTYAVLDFFHVSAAKDAAFEEAKRLSNGKGIVNIGAGPHRMEWAKIIAKQPEVVANVDIVLDGLPHFTQLDIGREALPFADKQFGCAFASHILEHLDNWQFALAEACRVADNVVIVLPHPAYFSGWLTAEHQQHFSTEDINEIAQFYPNVEVYY